MGRAHSAIDKPDRVRGGPDDLIEIARRFEVLQGQLDLLAKLSKDVRAKRGSFEDLDCPCEKQSSLIFDEMTELAWSAVSLRSTKPDHWRAKALILLDCCVPQDGDIVHCLAESLCKDFCEFLGTNRSSEGPQPKRVGNDKAASTMTGGTD